MSMKNLPSSVTDGLVFHYDMNNPKSWKGKPTTNYAYDQNPSIDTTYASRIYTSANTYPVHHPDGITVYNPNGGNISDYVNTGVTDWTNTYHAIWTYDRALRKPVVTMRDVDAAWKAKSFTPSIGGTPAAMGLGYGDLYTISWQQWTDNISKSVNAGMYGANTSGVNNFHDGLSQAAYDSTYAFNTKPYTWQRVWATFQVNATRNLSSWWGCYMYGYFNARNTVKIADVQIETGYVSPLVENGASTRSNTQALLDLTGRNTITATSLTYAADGTFSFDGSGDYAIISTFINKPTIAITCEAWIKPTKPTLSGTIRGGAISATNSMYLGIIDSVDGGQTHALHWANQTTVNRVYSWNGNVPNNAWSHIVGTYDGSTMRAYLNGVQIYEAAQTGTIPDATYYIGTYGQGIGDGVHDFNGSISQAKIYNRALTASEIQQNFNAHRGRYGI